MGFRVPGDFSEDAHLCASAPRIKKHSSLDPERSMSFNLSLDYAKNGFRTGLNLFRTNISDKVVLGAYSGSDEAFDLEWENSEGQALTQGFELSGDYKGRFFSVGAGYGLTDARYEDEQIEGNENSIYIPRSPRHNAHIDIGLFSDKAGTAFTDGWSLDVSLRLVGPMFIERDGDVIDAYPEENLEEIVETDAYVTGDLRVNKRFNALGLDVYIAAENFTNTVQKREQWDVDDAAMVFAPLYGTTVMGGFRKEF
jgi:outer membrane cobalamin receptor